MSVTKAARRVLIMILGGVLLLVGVTLLVLPGPGLLLVLAGLVVLGGEFPGVEKYVDPVRERALLAAEQSVASPVRIAGSVLAGLLLMGAGIAWGTKVWGTMPGLPLGGWSTGTSLILSGLILLGLLVYSYRRVQAKRRGA